MRALILAIIAIFSVTTALSAQKAEKLSVRGGQQKTLPASRIAVKFVSVVEDSRCPQGVNCIWAGVATIRIQVRKSGKPAKEFELNTNQLDKSVTFEGHEIKLVGLTPYPQSDSPIRPDAYSAALTIKKLPK
jgi:hypothetical protein